MGKSFNNNSLRLSRVNELIKRELSSLLQGMEWVEQGVQGFNITLTDVECSKDIRIAKIYYIPVGVKNSLIIKKVINERKKEIRKYLGKKLHLKYTPELRFIEDNSFEAFKKTSEILEKLSKNKSGI
ncbi:MAG: 30S ribosome-binding factor RbfA [Paracoccaceae bacterium]|tara:strand:- start:140 stop:520 length:381 start_codon:yes stop_codon:yes gene_type:complete